MAQKRTLLTLLAALFLVAATFANAAAQQGQPEGPTADEVNAIAKELYCPVCESTPLDVCPTQACAEWRELIRLKLSEGWSERQIKNYFAEQYGDRVLAVPPARGLNWLVYILPPLAFLAGVYLVFKAFQTWRRPSAVNEESPVGITEPPAGESDEYVARLEEELKKR